MEVTRVVCRAISGAALAVVCAIAPCLAQAQGFNLVGANVQQRANGVLALMGFTLTPDVTTGSLAINDGSASNPDFGQTSLGGGFTWSKSFPLYLEGTVAYARYDPTFVATNGQVDRPVPVKWNSVSATGGVGWDYPIAKDLVFRPIFNFSLGRVASDGAAAQTIIDNNGGSRELGFLANGKLKARGLGGTLMLDYERFRPEGDIDIELRYTDIELRSFDSAEAVSGSASAESLNLWARYRMPTGITMLERPLRYVFEYAYTRFYGDLDGALGFNNLHSIGVGIELDTSKYDMVVSRARLVVRAKRGDNVSGYSVGLAVSF